MGSREEHELLLKKNQELLAAIKTNLPVLEKLLESLDNEWTGPDGIYRRFHSSFKVYHLQKPIQEVVTTLKWLMPDCELNSLFMDECNAGIAKAFSLDDNNDWANVTRPIVFAFLQCRYVLEMAIRCAKTVENIDSPLASDWALLLYIFNMR